MPPRAAATLSVFLSGAVLAACAWSATARAEPVSAGTGIPPAAPTQVTPVAGGLEHPWAMAFLPDGGILITERPGNLRLLRIPGGLSAPLKGVPKVAAQGRAACSTWPCRRISPRTAWSTCLCRGRRRPRRHRRGTRPSGR